MTTPLPCPMCSTPMERGTVELVDDYACPECGLAGPRDVLDAIAALRTAVDKKCGPPFALFDSGRRYERAMAKLREPSNG